jgi:hypothetical protein
MNEATTTEPTTAGGSADEATISSSTSTPTVTVPTSAPTIYEATESSSPTSSTNPSHELNKNANHVYIRDDTYSWVPAQVLERPTDAATVVVNVPLYINEQAIQCDGGKKARKWERRSCDLTLYPNHALPLQNVNAEGSLQVVEDMVDLPFLHEVSINGAPSEISTTCVHCGVPYCPHSSARTVLPAHRDLTPSCLLLLHWRNLYIFSLSHSSLRPPFYTI